MRALSLLYLYPEELRLGGVAQTAELVERLGAGGAALALAYHPARRWLPRFATVSHSPPGAWYLEPGDRYPDSLRPRRTADSVTVRAVHQLRDELGRRGLAFHAWLVLLHSDPLVAARPDLGATTLDGVRTVHALCPAHEEVRAYAAAVVDDVCRQLGPDGLELEAALPAGWLPSYTASLELAPAPDVWGVCTCRACEADLAACGEDPDAAWLSARRGEPPEALLEARRRIAALSLAAVGSVAARHGTRSRALLFGRPDELRWQGVDAASVAGVDAVMIGAGAASGPDLSPTLAGVAALIGEQRFGASMNWAPARDAATFASDTRRAMDAGADSISLYNLSLVPAGGLPSLEAATTAAREHLTEAQAGSS